ncbi:unnamed protein product [Owenia fusiformis]|uniref:Uncharacterized protein n=1 Tax=Owenia fusiformis TaxID=6347 RepID=A0A8S4NUE6_OWEFU|nr:unnamed protein product [Owenia fusiformis]
MARNVTLFILLNICIAMVADRSNTYLDIEGIRYSQGFKEVYDKVRSLDMAQYNDIIFESMTCTFDKLTSTTDDFKVVANDTFDNIKEATAALADEVLQWVNETTLDIISGMKDLIAAVYEWINATTDSISGSLTDFMNDTIHQVNELIDSVAQSKFGIWLIKNDPFKSRDLFERAVIHLVGMLCIIAFSIKVIIVETARLRHTPPKPDDYQAYCRHIEELLSEDDTISKKSKPVRDIMPKYGWNKKQRRGMRNVTNKQIMKIVIQHKQKEQESKRAKTQTLSYILSCIYGL